MKTIACLLAGFAISMNVFAADANKGAELLKKNQCASCHGDDFVKGTDPSFPILAGQHRDYLVQALRQYRAADNKKAALARTNPIMAGQAKKLSDADIDNIAAYLSGLKSGLSTHK